MTDDDIPTKEEHDKTAADDWVTEQRESGSWFKETDIGKFDVEEDLAKMKRVVESQDEYLAQVIRDHIGLLQVAINNAAKHGIRVSIQPVDVTMMGGSDEVIFNVEISKKL